MSLVRQTRGGKLYQTEWGKRQTGTGPYADQIAKRFHSPASRHGLQPATRP